MKCGSMGCGGPQALISPHAKTATANVQSHCDTVKEAVCNKLGKTGDELTPYTALTYKCQIVAGTNFFVKIQVSESGDCVHARIFNPLPQTEKPAELQGIEADKKEADAITYF